LAFTDPSGHCIIQEIIVGICAAIGMTISAAAVTAVEIGIIAGAAFGATISGISGGNPLIGALMGAIAGGIFAGAGNLVQTLTGVTNIADFSTTQLIEASLIHVGAGAMSGAINAGITGGNVGLSAFTSGISAGVAEGVGGAIAGTNWFSNLQPEEKFFAGLVSHVGIGAVTGGITSEIVCGQFIHGFGQGAWTAAFGFIFNKEVHDFMALTTTGDSAAGPDAGLNWRYLFFAAFHAADAFACLSLAVGLPVFAFSVDPLAGALVFGTVYFPMRFSQGVFWDVAKKDWQEFLGH
jgi:hypothetical protein